MVLTGARSHAHLVAFTLHSRLFSFVPFVCAEEVPVRDDIAHKGIITNATHITLANGADRYVTCSRDGMVKIWNAKVGWLFL